ncbi:winged helix-turn-helix transcriptional regulator [Levilactobacillus bambusae]|uniref:Transcriptional regulator n=1 Tax=Levilactobacillus bambusae TaxID=2024736 RepID=A0A2V1N137_9LACO|nr:helix-turn-helix domain-containing protein [Levilactobacillus bambusae]PWG00458.1 transcriptional regulator [Levilactobacillus bambusae]
MDYLNPNVPLDYYHDNCPTLMALKLVNQKWKLPILWQIGLHQELHYNQLKRQLIGITNTMLAKSLRELDGDGLVLRHQFDTTPPTVTYALTDQGKQLLITLEGLREFGEIG